MPELLENLIWDFVDPEMMLLARYSWENKPIIIKYSGQRVICNICQNNREPKSTIYGGKYLFKLSCMNHGTIIEKDLSDPRFLAYITMMARHEEEWADKTAKFYRTHKSLINYADAIPGTD